MSSGASPKGFREHHWGCFEMDWMRGKKSPMTYDGLEDVFKVIVYGFYHGK